MGEMAAGKRRERTWTWAGVIAAVGVIAIGLSGAELMMAAPWMEKAKENGEPSERETFAVLRPGEWVGREFWLAKFIDVGEELKKGKWIVVVYAHDCPHCRAAMPMYRRVAEELGMRRISGVGTMPSPQPSPGVPGEGEAAPRMAMVQMAPYASEGEKGAWLEGKLSARYDWFVHTPVEVFVEEGVVKDAKQRDEAFSGGRGVMAGMVK